MEINNVVISGRVKALRARTKKDIAYVNFQLVHIEVSNNRSAYNEYSCAAFGETAKQIMEVTENGSRIVAMGRVQSRRLFDAHTQRSRTIIEIVVNRVIQVVESESDDDTRSM